MTHNGHEEPEQYPVDPPEVPWEPPPPPKRVSDTDRLRVENLQLRLEKAQLEITLTTSQLNDRVKYRGEVMKMAESLRNEILDRYGIDIYKGKINEDGTFMAGAVKPPGS